MLGVGADLEEFQALFAPRIEELERQFIAPLDELGEAIARAERELRTAASPLRRSRRSGASTSRGTNATCTRNPSPRTSTIIIRTYQASEDTLTQVEEASL